MKKLLNQLKGTLLLLLLLISIPVLAAKPVKPPPEPATIVDSVIIDYNAGTISISGSGLGSIGTTVGIGNIEVTGAIVGARLENSLILDFNSDTAGAVTTAGSYLLNVNDSTLSVYFKAAVYNQDTSAACPCQSMWDNFKNDAPPLGFAGLAPVIATNTSEKVEVYYVSDDLTQLWMLNSEFSESIQQCDLVIDGSPVPVTLEEHVACSSYLRNP